MRIARLSRALAATGLISALAGACSGAGTSTEARPTTTTAAERARCGVYRQMANSDFRVASRGALATTDWPRFRQLLIAGNRSAEVDLTALARVTTGSLRADARRVAAFMPASRALAGRSPSFAQYRRDLRRLPGDEAVRAATARVNADARRTCAVTITHPLVRAPKS